MSYFLGFDLSTQQIKAVVVDENLHQVYQNYVEFDVDTPSYKVSKGVYKNPADNSVYAPVAMWIDALEILLNRMKEDGFAFEKVKAVSGACQQHGSVFLSHQAPNILAHLNPAKPLTEQLSPAALSHKYSPNWQDHSTAEECAAYEAAAGGAEALCQVTGSKAHHRFTGPQILKFRKQHPDRYEATSRIALVSSFLTSIFLGSVAPLDISDVCGMNLWDVQKGTWMDSMIALTAGSDDAEAKQQLLDKLGPVDTTPEKPLGNISQYFVSKYGFPADCAISNFTGDNPGTILALPLQSSDLMISLGTSTTVLLTTDQYVPNPIYHVFGHPTTAGLYMGMVCYCNGSLAREEVRNDINAKYGITAPHHSPAKWEKFNQLATETPVFGSRSTDDPAKLGIYFPLAEIVPDAAPGVHRYEFDPIPGAVNLREGTDTWNLPEDDARAIVESQALSMRMRAGAMLSGEAGDARPGRLFFVGGASKNTALCKVMAEVLAPKEGSWRVELANACATGAAYKAAWVGLYKEGWSFQDMMNEKFDMTKEGLIARVDEDVSEQERQANWDRYAVGVEALAAAEARL